MPSYVFSFRTKVDRQITAEQELAWPQWFQEIGASVLDFGHRVLRLSYRRAAELFEQHTGVGPFISSGTRHSPMRPKCGPTPRPFSATRGHTSVASLPRYARVSPERLARWQENRDPATRRRG